MPPLGTALVVIGVGVALLAKTQRERRAAAAERAQRDRRPALRAHEPFAEGLQRVIIGQLDLAIELLEECRERDYQPRSGGASRGGQSAADRAEAGASAVHEVRKALKRLRALLRLAREELGDERYTHENVALRDCGRRLAGARDAEVMLSTLDSLMPRESSRLSRSTALRGLRTQLLAEREHAAAHAIGDPRVCDEVIGELYAALARVESWEHSKRGFEPIALGLERIYARGRAGMRTARRRRSAEALHVWRKRVKELRYATETFDRGGKSYKPVRRIARRADRLGEILGEEHDLALLHERVRERSRLFAGERKTRKRLLELIARRRKQLRKRALREGQRLYERKPKRFVRRVKQTQ